MISLLMIGKAIYPLSKRKVGSFSITPFFQRPMIELIIIPIKKTLSSFYQKCNTKKIQPTIIIININNLIKHSITKYHKLINYTILNITLLIISQILISIKILNKNSNQIIIKLQEFSQQNLLKKLFIIFNQKIPNGLKMS